MGELPSAIEVIGVFPHMHLTGRKLSASIENGGASSCIADVPRYNFDWQRLYLYSDPLRVTAADRISVTCEFDTSGRTEPTSAGFASLDEMCSFILLGVEEP